MYYISRLIRSCDLSIYSFKKWQRLTRTFDKKNRNADNDEGDLGGGPSGRGRGWGWEKAEKSRGTMTRAKKKSGTWSKLDVEAREKKRKCAEELPV